MHASVRHHTSSRDGYGTVSQGRLQLSVAVIAWGASGIIHCGLLTTCYVVSWNPEAPEPPRIEFARGEQAVQVSILSTHWPDPEAPVNTPPEVDEEPIEISTEIAPQPTPVLLEPENPEPVKELETPEEETVRAVLPIDSTLPTPEPAATIQPPIDDRSVDQAIDDTAEAIPPIVVTPPTALPPPTALSPSDATLRNEPSTKAPPVEEVADAPVAPTNDTPPAVEREVAPDHGEASSLNQPVVSPHAPAPNSQAGVEIGVEVLDLPHPRYPIVSRRLGEEGTVLIQVEVLANGKVGRVHVLSDSGYPRLARAAIAAVRNAHFRPAMHRGAPTTDSVRIPFRFVLE